MDLSLKLQLFQASAWPAAVLPSSSSSAAAVKKGPVARLPHAFSVRSCMNGSL
jgi:hypothetical protein